MRAWVRGARAVLLVALVVVGGCAIENSGLPGSQAAVVRAYGRNPVVQAPTAVGNVLGLFVALPVYMPAACLVDWTSGGRKPAAIYRAGWIAAVPVYAFGAMTGTPFLPLAFLRPEERLCLMC